MKLSKLLLPAIACLGQQAMAGNLNQAKPNVIMLYYDDMGYGDMGANGATGLKIPKNSKYLDHTKPTLTPHLDRFVEGAMRFTNGHSADGVCTPSRYAILTGRYCWRTSRKQGVTGGFSKTFMSEDRFSIGKLFQKHGYETAMVGKWHIGMQFYNADNQPIDYRLSKAGKLLEEGKVDLSKPLTDTPYHRGFDYYFGTSASLDMPPYVWLESDKKADTVHAYTKGGVVVNGKVDFTQKKIARNSELKEGRNGEGGRPGAYDPNFKLRDYLQVQAQKVADIIAERDKDDKPFFIYIPMPAPHTPHTVQKKFKGSAGYTYGDYVVQTDHYTGQIIDALGDPNDPKSLASNTVFFITSDNGPEKGAFKSSIKLNHDANGPYAGVKRDSYEGGTRVPFIVRWPGKVKPGTTANLPCWQGDFMATMADVLNYKLKSDEAPDAESFLPVLLGKKMPKARREAFIEHSVSGQFAIVDKTGEWKLIDGTGGGGNKKTWDADNKFTINKGKITGKPRQLFNLFKDPGERNNLLANDPTPKALAKEKELYQLLNIIRGDKKWGRDGNSNVPR